MRRVDDVSMRDEMNSFAAFCRSRGAQALRQVNVSVEAFLYMHGSQNVKNLPPAQRLQFLVFCDHLKTLVGRD